MPEGVQAEINPDVIDINMRGIVVALMGIFIAAAGLWPYSFGVLGDRFEGADAWSSYPGLIWAIGFAMICIGIAMNVGQRLPVAARTVFALELLASVMGLIAGALLAVTPTGEDLEGNKLYENRVPGGFFIATLGFLPMLLAWELLGKGRWKRNVVISICAAILVVIWLALTAYYDLSVVLPLAAAHILVLAGMFLPSVKSHYLGVGGGPFGPLAGRHV